MKLSKQFILALLITAGLFLGHASIALAGDPTQIIHVSDEGSIININVGDTIQFSLDENIPNTTLWGNPLVAWTNVSGSIQETDAGILYDFTQDPIVIQARTFTYYGVKAGQTVLIFYKSGTTSNANGATKMALTDSTHPIVTTLTFVINVNSSTK